MGHNVHEKIQRCQSGGTAMMVTRRLANYVLDMDCDSAGLGRWVHITIGSKHKKIHVIVVYCPCTKSYLRRRGKSSLALIVWEQEERYFG